MGSINNFIHDILFRFVISCLKGVNHMPFGEFLVAMLLVLIVGISGVGLIGLILGKG